MFYEEEGPHQEKLRPYKTLQKYVTYLTKQKLVHKLVEIKIVSWLYLRIGSKLNKYLPTQYYNSHTVRVIYLCMVILFCKHNYS